MIYLDRAKPDWLVQTMADLDRHEGFRAYAYPDPRSKLGRKYVSRKWNWGFEPGDILLARYGEDERDGRPWTVGHGFTRGVTPSSRISKQESDKRLEAEIIDHVRGLENLAPNWWDKPLHVSTVLVNLAYNLGLEKLSAFAPTLALFNSGMYRAAAARLRKTAWFHQVGSRGVELVNRLDKGRIEPEHLVIKKGGGPDTIITDTQCIYKGDWEYD